MLESSPEGLVPEVAFLSAPPEIDGLLDAGLEGLPIGRFSEALVDGFGPEVEQETFDSVQAARPEYRLAYGTDFFYLYVEVPGEELHFRDRAYQNGDGFNLMLGAARADGSPTEEFYVLACSAVDEERLAWTRCVFWYYNVDGIFLPASPGTRLELGASDGRIRFELLLPWTAVHPHHPWLSEGIGFNLRFVAAMGEGARRKYIVVPDSIGAENRSRRYVPLSFEEPALEDGTQLFVQPGRNHLRAGEGLGVQIVSASAGEARSTLDVSSRAGASGCRAKVVHESGGGVTHQIFELDTGGLAAGPHAFEWEVADSAARGAFSLTVLPDVDCAALGARLENARERLAPGSLTTLQHAVQSLDAVLASVEPYETCDGVITVIDSLLGSIERVEAAEDPYARRTGFFRRAFRSKLDDTLQPYTVIVPQRFDPSHSYPLIVFLHGSASDETDLAGFRELVPPDAIGLGPLGRGPSTLYCFDHAQTDIAEAIADVQANYPIDATRIVLTGFSMGGYGVYRTFYETPDKFRALAVLSGHPGYDRDGGEDGVPVLDFRRPERLGSFEGIPIFITHGEHDRNCDFAPTAELVELLGEAGADVYFLPDPELGHSAPSAATYREYRDWLEFVLADD